MLDLVIRWNISDTLPVFPQIAEMPTVTQQVDDHAIASLVIFAASSAISNP